MATFIQLELDKRGREMDPDRSRKLHRKLRELRSVTDDDSVFTSYRTRLLTFFFHDISIKIDEPKFRKDDGDKPSTSRR